MPLYNLRCDTCGNTADMWSSVADRNTTRCVCGDLMRVAVSPIPAHLEFASGDFPGALSRWERQRDKLKTHTEN